MNSSEQNVFENKSFTVNGVTFDMIAVKGGTFTMGSTGVYADSDEMPTHNVTVSNFYIGKFEATQKLWKAVMGNNPRYFKGNPTGPSSGSKRVRRGGGWGSQAESCRVSKRDYYDPDNRYYYNGFRLVLVP